MAERNQKYWGIKSPQKYFSDLKQKLKPNKKTKTNFFLHYCHTFRLDRIHAEQLKFLNNVSLIKHPIGAHELIKKIKETGDLEKIIKETVTLNNE
jgi:hypothetical protein